MGTCTSEIYYPHSTHPWMVYIFLLSWSVRLFSGLFSKAASPPIVFTPASWCVFHLTIGFVYFYKASFQNFGLLKKNGGLCSVIKGVYFWSFLSGIFQRRIQSCQQNISPANLCASCWSFYFRSILSAVSSLIVGLLAMYKLDSLLKAPLHYWGSLWWFNIYKCFFRKKLFFLNASGVLENDGWLPFSLIGFWVYPYFIMLCEEERIKWRY